MDSWLVLWKVLWFTALRLKLVSLNFSKVLQTKLVIFQTDSRISFCAVSTCIFSISTKWNLAGALSQEPLPVWSIQSIFPGKKATHFEEALKKFLFWRGSHMTDAVMHQYRTLVGPWRFILGSICPCNPFERHRRFTSPSELRAHKTFGVTQTRMSLCTCIDGPFRRHFARARAKGKRSFRTDWLHLHVAPFRTFGRSISDLQLICRISRLIWLLFGVWVDLWSLALHALPGVAE